ncbi:MbnP family protein [Polaribacter sp.]|uniref:MbnP family protein n=1 Tax=Polaribacter sp. TaxID=1920175 RepID=UPI003F6B91E2
MKKLLTIIVFITLTFYGCKQQTDCCVMPPSVNIIFTHNWDGTPITEQDFNQFKFTNANGEKLSIERLRYLVSNISLNGNKNYFLVNVGENSGQEITISDIADSNKKLTFTFGFKDEDNIDGVYQFLNSVNFNVPPELGGGYHYMQFDGKYLDINNQETGFNYHAIRAVDKTDPDNLIFEDTSFEVDLGRIEFKENATIEIKVNIAEWFKNPNTWNLNELNTVLMPNFEAQKLMSANGKSVFSLGKVD